MSPYINFDELMSKEFPALARAWGMDKRINHRLGSFKGNITVYCNTKSPKYNLGKFRTWLNSHGIDIIFYEQEDWDCGGGWEAVVIRPVAF